MNDEKLLPSDSKIFDIKIILFTLGISLSAGIALGSAIDLFTLSYLARFPYRFPFDRTMLWLSSFALLYFAISFSFNLIVKNITVKNKLLSFILSFIVCSVFAVIFSVLWNYGIDTIHNLKITTFFF